MIHVIWDETRRAKVVAEGRNDWFRYVEEMLDCLGAAHGRLAPDRVAEACPGEGDVIFLPGDEVSPACGKALGEALARGCRVVGFATRGADDLFGLAPGKGGYTAPDFTYAGTLRLTEAAALPGLEPAPLPLFASVRAVVPRDARVLGTVEAGGTEYPGLTRRGGAYYFAFDLPQSVSVSYTHLIAAKPMPVFPELGSTITAPSRNRPRRSASSIIPRAMRSFTEPPGFCASSLTRIRAPSFSSRSRRVNSNKGVFPTSSAKL